MKQVFITGLAASLILSGCATTSTPKTTTPEQQADIRQNQANYEKSMYTVVSSNNIEIGYNRDKPLQLILRETKPAHEPELTIVRRGKSTAVNAALVASMFLSLTPTATIRKDDFKGTKLEPAFKNPILTYANPAFSAWLSAHHSELTPSDKPLEKVTVTAHRFTLIYSKLVGAESYELNNELVITLQNNWDNRTAYKYLCDIKSTPKTLSEWQANNYQAVDNAVKENINTCLTELDNRKAEIYTHLAK